MEISSLGCFSLAGGLLVNLSSSVFRPSVSVSTSKLPSLVLGFRIANLGSVVFCEADSLEFGSEDDPDDSFVAFVVED